MKNEINRDGQEHRPADGFDVEDALMNVREFTVIAREEKFLTPAIYALLSTNPPQGGYQVTSDIHDKLKRQHARTVLLESYWRVPKDAAEALNQDDVLVQLHVCDGSGDIVALGDEDFAPF